MRRRKLCKDVEPRGLGLELSLESFLHAIEASKSLKRSHTQLTLTLFSKISEVPVEFLVF